MTDLAELDRALRVIYTDPKLKAVLEWSRDYSLGAQLMGQVGTEAARGYVETGEWADPEQRVELVLHEPIDFDWWEPRHDQPWRRQQARFREAGL